MDNKEILVRAVRILAEESTLAAQVITDQRKLTVAQIANVLINVEHPDLRIPSDDVAHMFQELGHVSIHSRADARSLIDAILRAQTRMTGDQ